MDLSIVEKDEAKRQELISEQKGDGRYNPITGVYKWGQNVYDLTKTNGEYGLGWLPIRGKMINYNTK
jgi:hypothetical protein